MKKALIITGSAIAAALLIFLFTRNSDKDNEPVPDGTNNKPLPAPPVGPFNPDKPSKDPAVNKDTTLPNSNGSGSGTSVPDSAVITPGAPPISPVTVTADPRPSAQTVKAVEVYPEQVMTYNSPPVISSRPLKPLTRAGQGKG